MNGQYDATLESEDLVVKTTKGQKMASAPTSPKDIPTIGATKKLQI